MTSAYAITIAVGAALTFFGLIHAEAIGIRRTPTVAVSLVPSLLLAPMVLMPLLS